MELNVERALECLKAHYKAFEIAHQFALETDQVTPDDTSAWSQVLISLLIGIKGYARQKNPDFIDDSDVKAASTWDAIDTPRFNGVIKAGTKSILSGKMDYLDATPYLFFVLWDTEPEEKRKRVRIWVVQPPKDPLFREMCQSWYEARRRKMIVSSNFQLHPPRNSNSSIIRNSFGKFEYPLLFTALWNEEKQEYEVEYLDEDALSTKFCSLPK